MRETAIFFAALLPLILGPAASLADEKEDLEATMTVLDDPSGLDDSLQRLQPPDDAGKEVESEDEGSDGESGPDIDDGFEHDDVYGDHEMETEDDFEEGEDIDDDTFDE